MLITFIYVRRWVIGISFALSGMVARAEFSAERMVLVEPRLEGAAADRVRHWQEAVRSEARDPVVAFEQLGWAYVKLGRESWDAGFFKLAELTAQVMEATEGPIPAAQLLKGHALVQMHRFAEAEELAQALVAQRGEPRDYALLADATMEQGKLAAAVAACQQFVNRYPGLESYARVAQLRWLHGDLAGAVAAMTEAVQAAGRDDAETTWWVQTRLAHFHFLTGNITAARHWTEQVLQRAPDYAPALLLRGRLALAEGQAAAAVTVLARAAQLNPLPEYRWWWAEALSTAGQADALARTELADRQDALTLDALAWALCANQELAAARDAINRALATGLDDARVWLHAGVIARQCGETETAAERFAQARRLSLSLLPSERRLLPALD